MTAGKDIIRLREVGTIQLLLKNRSEMILFNVAFALRYDSNLISLGQVREARISYHNHPNNMILKQSRSIIRLV